MSLHSFPKIAVLFACVTFIFISCKPERSKKTIFIDSPASNHSMYPTLFTDNSGKLFMSWMEKSGNLTSLRSSAFNGDSWSNPVAIASDSTWFINWADYPSIIAQNGKPVAVHWLNKVSGGTYAYHINMKTFEERWSSTFIPHKDDSPTEHGFVSMQPASDSTFMAIWLDGRRTHDREDHQYSNINKAMTLRGAMMDIGATVIDRYLIDENVCDCCNTALTKTDNGFIAAYRNRTSGEIRDIYISTFANGKWSKGKPVHSDNWEIAACPVNGPAIGSNKSTVAIAWFTGAGNKPLIKMAISNDYGDTFHAPLILDKNNPQGRMDLSVTEEKIWVSWLAPREDEAILKVRSFNFEGNELSSHRVTGLSGERKSGFPQISPLKNKLIIAYTDLSGETPMVKTRILN